MPQVFNPFDAPSAKLATMFCTIGDRRYAMLNAKNFEAVASVQLGDVPRLGAVIAGKKQTGLEVKLTITVYKVSEMFDKVVEEYKNTGILPTFEVQVASEDGASVIGRSEKVYHDCVLSGDVLLSMFDADGEFVEQEIECYALDFASNERYTEPEYM